MIDSFFDHKRTFNNLVQNLITIDKNIDFIELIVLYANSLSIQIFDN